MASPPALHAAPVYKWVDEDGRVHYGDHIPAQQVNRSYSQFGASGNVIDTVEAQKTAEERRRELEIEQRVQKREHRDMLLLQTFTSRAELAAARDDRIATIDGAIRVAASTIDKLEQDRQALVRQAADHERKGQAIPEHLTGQIDSLERQIAQQRQYTATKEAEKTEIERQYAKDIQRFQELTAETQGAPP